MKLEELNKLKIGDIIYSFFGHAFYIYKVTNISLFTHEITVCIESINNMKVNNEYSIINIPTEERYNDIRYGYEFTMMDLDLNTAYQNYSEYVDIQINKFNGLRGNMKGLKRQYMLSMNMDDNDIPDWKRLGYKSKRAYDEYLNDMYDDIRHGYVG